MHANCPMHLILLGMITVIIYSELYKLLSYLLCNECIKGVSTIQEVRFSIIYQQPSKIYLTIRKNSKLH